MILFKKDWDSYDVAIADSTTRNNSFLRTASLLKSMKVQHYYMHLALLQPSLRGVDPFSDNLTSEQKTAIGLECRYNPWYYFREIHRIPSGSNPIQFRSNRAVISLIWAFFNSIDYSLIMPRQTGKSVTADAINIYLLTFGMDGQEILLFTKDTALRKKNIKRLKETIDLLPKWLNPTNGLDLDNTEAVSMVAKGNLLKTAVGQQQKERANNIGRGETLPITQTDECPYIPNVHVSLPVIMAATGAARDNAEDAGEYYGNMFTTTAGKKDTKEGKFMYNFIHNGMYWNELLYDLEDKAAARTVITTNSKGKHCIINGTFSHRQVGYTDEWLYSKIPNGMDTDAINRDFFNKWTSGTESNPLSTMILEVISNSEVEPSYTYLTADNYMVYWYIDENLIDSFMRDNHHIIGLDTGNAIGVDANGLIFTNIKDMSITGTCSVTEANLHKYALWVCNLLLKYENTTLIIENKSSAQGIIDTISAILTSMGIDPFTRMYSYIVDNHLTMEDEYSAITRDIRDRTEDVFLKYKKYIGFNTNGNRRDFLYSTVLQDAAKSTGHLIKDKGLSNEIRSLIIKNGRVDHQQGGHDDICIAWLLTNWMVKHSKNLQHYGIPVNECLSLVADDGASLTKEELNDRRLIKVLSMEIDDLKANLIASPNIVERYKYEKLLGIKVKEIRGLGDITLSINKIMEEVTERRVSKRSLHKAVSRFNSKKYNR